ncbi:Profilin/allergen [Cystobasidium minutum MCA 4210]|uniref:Profilin/allergen n=1 Tax=Cystobasidium minutum MCA 4210 TaxID=1397322 RepID=UPI0034CEFCBB|eukprot:jgi/Rhomi1/197492/gm1.5706_g
MSWDAYVSDHLVGSGKLSEAAIIGLDGGVWAISPGLQITPEQEAALVKAYKQGPDDLQAHGIHIGKEKYMFLRPVEDSFYGKKGGDGICVTKSGKAILVGEYKEPIMPADANKVVEDMAAYLVSVGF